MHIMGANTALCAVVFYRLGFKINTHETGGGPSPLRGAKSKCLDRCEEKKRKKTIQTQKINVLLKKRKGICQKVQLQLPKFLF